MLLGLAGLDTAADIRDLTYDLSNWEWTPGHVAQTALDAIGFVPGIGVLKNADEVAAVLKGVLGNADAVLPALRALTKNADEAGTVLKGAATYGDETGAVLKGLFGSTDEAADLAGASRKAANAAEGMGETAKAVAGESDEIGKAIDAYWNSNEITGDFITEGAGETKLYRVMSDAEYQSIINNGGKFSTYDRAMEEKWFATSPEDAAKWAEKFYPDGRYRMIEVEVPTDSLNQMYQVGKLDGIGPAYSGGIDFLNSIMKGLRLK